MRLVDSHCHLDDKQFAGDREAVVERAREAGVEYLMAIGTGDGPQDLETAIRLADCYPFFYATVGCIRTTPPRRRPRRSIVCAICYGIQKC